MNNMRYINTLIPGNAIFSIPIFSLAVNTFLLSPCFNKALFGFMCVRPNN